MKHLVLVLGVAALAVAGCGRSKSEMAAGESAPSFAEPQVAADMAAPSPAAEGAAREASGSAGQPAPVRPSALLPMMAYEYLYRLEAPVKRLPELLEKHEKACVDAGPTVCQVVGAEITSEGQDSARGRLVVRAAPDWLKRFRATLKADTEAAGGRVANANVQAEDLTRAIVDTEANLRAKKSLRDRLEALLASRPGKLQELLEVERELARVQGEIDATESELAVMRTRVATSKLTIDYVSEGVIAPDSAVRPLTEAVNDVAGYFFGGLALIVILLAVLAPFALVFGPLGWLLLRWLKKRRAARLAAAGAPAPAPEAPRKR